MCTDFPVLFSIGIVHEEFLISHYYSLDLNTLSKIGKIKHFYWVCFGSAGVLVDTFWLAF